jgi:hypothetical protein
MATRHRCSETVPDNGMTLGERLPREMARVACDVMPLYAAIGLAGAPALELMKRAIRAAADATVQQDVVAMLLACRDLEGFQE